MSTSAVETALDLVRSYSGRKHFVGGRSSDLIRVAEKALGVEFPPSYRRFLEELGAGSISGSEVYGITDGTFTDSAVPNGIWLGLREREDSLLPAGLVVVSDSGEGDYLAIDARKSDGNGEAPVVLWSPGASVPGQHLEQAATDSGSYFLELVKEATA